jgi:hypothetical protein
MMQFEIETYLNGEMSDSERTAFEAAIAADPNLRAEVEAMRPLVRDLARIRLNQQVGKATNNRLRRKRARRAAFVLSLGLGFLGGFMWWKYYENRAKLEQIETPKPTFQQEKLLEPTKLAPEIEPQKLEFAPKILKEKINREIAANSVLPNEKRNYRSFAEEYFVESENTKLADTFLLKFSPFSYLNMAGFNDFWMRGEFDKYIAAIEAAEAEKGPGGDGLILVKAASLLKLHRPSEAMSDLFKIKNKNLTFNQEAEYLLVISFLMQEKLDAARNLLEKISGNAIHLRAGLATEMLSVLEAK